MTQVDKRVTTVILGVVAGLFFTLVGQIDSVNHQANATHTYTGIRWPSYVGGPYCVDNSMGRLNIGLSRSNDAAFTASDHINDLSGRFVLPKIANSGDCRSHIYAASLAISTTGRSDYTYNSAHRLVYENIVMNQNIPWTSSGCVNGQYPLRLSFALKHEFSHWIIMGHSSDTSSITYPAYRCTAWDAFNSHDAGTVRSVYG